MHGKVIGIAIGIAIGVAIRVTSKRGNAAENVCAAMSLNYQLGSFLYSSGLIFTSSAQRDSDRELQGLPGP